MYRKALVITPNYSLQFILRSVLSKSYQYNHAPNVLKAMPLLRQGVDLVVLDLDHNYEEGVDFLHHLQTSSLCHTPIILLSSGREAEELAALHQDVEFYRKPFNPLQLLKTADHLLSAVAS